MLLNYKRLCNKHDGYDTEFKSILSSLSKDTFRKELVQLIQDSPERNEDLVILFSLLFLQEGDSPKDFARVHHNVSKLEKITSRKLSEFDFLFNDEAVFFKLLKVFNTELNWIKDTISHEEANYISNNILFVIAHTWMILSRHKGFITNVKADGENFYLLKEFAELSFHYFNERKHYKESSPIGELSPIANSIYYSNGENFTFMFNVVINTYLPIAKSLLTQEDFLSLSWRIFFEPIFSPLNSNAFKIFEPSNFKFKGDIPTELYPRAFEKFKECTVRIVNLIQSETDEAIAVLIFSEFLYPFKTFYLLGEEELMNLPQSYRGFIDSLAIMFLESGLEILEEKLYNSSHLTFDRLHLNCTINTLKTTLDSINICYEQGAKTQKITGHILEIEGFVRILKNQVENY